MVYTVSLAVDGNGATEPAAGTHRYPEGEVVSVTAIPDDGWQFDGWSGAVTAPQSATTTLIVNSDETVTANFSPVVHTVSLVVDGNGATEPAVGTHRYPEGEVVSVTAIPDEGWQFDGWRGAVTAPQSATTTLMVNSDETVTANFSPVMHTVSLAVDGNGATEPAVGTYQYPEGEVVTVTAVPDEGWQFDGWSGAVTAPRSASTTLVVSSDETVTANFSPVEPTWWQVLRTVYDEVVAILKSLGGLFVESG